jgi:hypothetical protein
MVSRGTVDHECARQDAPHCRRLPHNGLARHKSGVHGVFGVAPAILSPVFLPVRTTHRRQDRQRYHRAVRTEYARIHASGAGFPELFISMSRTRPSAPATAPPCLAICWWERLRLARIASRENGNYRADDVRLPPRPGQFKPGGPGATSASSWRSMTIRSSARSW